MPLFFSREIFTASSRFFTSDQALVDEAKPLLSHFPPHSIDKKMHTWYNKVPNKSKYYQGIFLQGIVIPFFAHPKSHLNLIKMQVPRLRCAVFLVLFRFVWRQSGLVFFVRTASAVRTFLFISNFFMSGRSFAHRIWYNENRGKKMIFFNIFFIHGRSFAHASVYTVYRS